MDDVINVGPFLLQYKLLIIIISGIVGYLIIDFRFRYLKNPFRKQVTDIFSGAAFLLLFTWKFGPVLFHPTEVFQNPSLILYTNGNDKSFILGGILTILYLYIKSRKMMIALMELFDHLLIGILSSLFLYNLFNPIYGYSTNLPWGVSMADSSIKYHPIHLYFAIVFGIFLFIAFKTDLKKSHGELSRKMAIILGVCGMFFSFLSPQEIISLQLSLLQWISILLIIVGIIYKTEKEIVRTISEDKAH
ncbi:prolipoprotein diacylglyceryl transferase family protein [Peribacillus frigoritolerans]|uniref:prolipoprotein diacylglyceryl transferase family protein n=1 Tax=Peribacillus frigoritolerans TaxID=450367 RepID=UPI00207A70AD|nr:prolipoprotein diacylglyceryl transferase family protein [Peribacillus frigoritolerans]USK67264.1 prolipoprotein diacylglyceryl transferase [Peribacillus frigoritolerans]